MCRSPILTYGLCAAFIATAASSGALPLAGDLDFSGRVDVMDVQRAITGVLGCNTTSLSCDVDGSGTATAIDLQLVINAVLGYSIDSDGDGLSDAAEDALGTNRDVPDTDDDGVKDGQELLDGTIPTDNASVVAIRYPLPLIVIDTVGQAVPDEPKISASMTIIYDEIGGDNSLDSVHIDFQGGIGIERRGFSSQGFAKKQYGIELRDENGDDLNASLLGMPEEADWVLNGPYSDKSLMRNVLAYWLGNAVVGRYAPRTRFVEVYLNDNEADSLESCYAGVYVLMEKIKRDGNRVDIAKLTGSQNAEPEITGGYILEITTLDRLTEEDTYFATTRDTVLEQKYPKGSKITAEQLTWISSHLDAFEGALYGPNFQDPALGYAHYIDVPSFVDYILVFDLTKNSEAFNASGFLHKDRAGKIVMGPIWDFNTAMGNCEYSAFADPDGWFIGANRWSGRLLEHRDFRALYAARWHELRASNLSPAILSAKIDEWAALLDQPQRRNFRRWPNLGQYVWPNPAPYAATYEDEIASLKTWMEQRILWLDSVIDWYVDGPDLGSKDPPDTRP